MCLIEVVASELIIREPQKPRHVERSAVGVAAQIQPWVKTASGPHNPGDESTISYRRTGNPENLVRSLARADFPGKIE
jgi:hypothetical protein